MPVTKTAKRALRASSEKAKVNARILANLEIALKTAKKGKKKSDIVKAISLTDRAAKKKIIHKNKAARIKSNLSKLLPKQMASKSKTKKKKSSKK